MGGNRMTPYDKVFVAGGTGMVGSAILRGLIARGYRNLVASRHYRAPAVEGVLFESMDLRRQEAVDLLFRNHEPDVVIFAAARVGGIHANNVYRADFIFENLQIQNNVIHAAFRHGAKKLLFLGSSCIYPRDCPQPIREEYLLTGPLESTNEPYAIAKIAGLKLCESFALQHGADYLSVMPTNLYGPADTYDLEKSHVLPTLLLKMRLATLLSAGDRASVRRLLRAGSDAEAEAALERHGIRADEVTLWGTGAPRREFLHVDDLADACLHLLETVSFADLAAGRDPVTNTHVNIGTGEDLTIRELAGMAAEVAGFRGRIAWDAGKPDGTPRKLLDVTRIHAFGWRHRIPLREGMARVYDEFRAR